MHFNAEGMKIHQQDSLVWSRETHLP